MTLTFQKLLYLLQWKPFKYEKNAFYFILKALFVFKMFKCLSRLFGHVKNVLIRKIRLISTFLMSQPCKQTITIHMLLNISRSKGNQNVKFSQIIEYSKRK